MLYIIQVPLTLTKLNKNCLVMILISLIGLMYSNIDGTLKSMALEFIEEKTKSKID